MGSKRAADYSGASLLVEQARFLRISNQYRRHPPPKTGDFPAEILVCWPFLPQSSSLESFNSGACHEEC